MYAITDAHQKKLVENFGRKCKSLNNSSTSGYSDKPPEKVLNSKISYPISAAKCGTFAVEFESLLDRSDGTKN